MTIQVFMRSARARSVTLYLGCLLALAGCGDDSDSTTTDDDAGATADDDDIGDDDVTADDDSDADDDAPSGQIDAGRSDAGAQPRLDAGRDAGRSDASSVRVDASASVGDAGDLPDSPDATVAVDAGGVVDASTIDGGLDGGSAPSDAAVNDGTNYDEPGPNAVVQENNVGRGFENDVPDDTGWCAFVVPLLSDSESTPEEQRQFIEWPAGMERGLYTVFRPEVLEEGKKYPVVTWGNGTCATPFGYARLLKHLASHGYIVIGANDRQVGDGRSIRRALDWLRAENERSGSPYFGRVDLTRIGASGHSQGGGGIIEATVADARIIAAVPIQPSAGGALTKPTFFIAGANDTTVRPASVSSSYNQARGPAAYGLHKTANHITPIRNPQLMWGPIVAWFKAHLERDEAARDWFYGANCTVCGDSDWTLQRKNLN